MPASIRTAVEIASHLDALSHGAVFQAREVDDAWSSVVGELKAAFELTKRAATAEQPVVYIVSSEALLGRTGRGNAMVATGLLSAARTLAVELKRADVPVNVLGVGPDTETSTIATWVVRLLEPGGPTGELVQLDGTQIGKALP